MLNYLDALAVHSCLKVYLINSFKKKSLKDFLIHFVLTTHLQNYYVMISSVYFLTSVTIFAKHKGKPTYKKYIPQFHFLLFITAIRIFLASLITKKNLKMQP